MYTNSFFNHCKQHWNNNDKQGISLIKSITSWLINVKVKLLCVSQFVLIILGPVALQLTYEQQIATGADVHRRWQSGGVDIHLDRGEQRWGGTGGVGWGRRWTVSGGWRRVKMRRRSCAAVSHSSADRLLGRSAPPRWRLLLRLNPPALVSVSARRRGVKKPKSARLPDHVRSVLSLIRPS